MSEVVFILGAGASADAGAPVMGNFIELAEKVLNADSSLQKLSRAADNLQQVQAKSSFDINNIESIFGAIEMGRLIQRFPGIEPEELDDLSDAINHVITATLQKTIQFPIENQQIQPTASYKTFANMLNKLSLQSHNRVSVITFNYDVALDYALHFQGTPAQYYVSINDTYRTGVPLLKLHGSLNWGKCKHCGNILVADKFFTNLSVCDDGTTLVLDLAAHLRKLSCCHSPLDGKSVLVPPTWNKTEYHEPLRHVWKQAAIELSEAQQVYILGYSLPPSDSFFSYLFALGSVGGARLRKVTAYDPDELIEGRLSNIFAPHVTKLFRCHEFRAAIGYIAQELNVRE